MFAFDGLSTNTLLPITLLLLLMSMIQWERDYGHFVKVAHNGPVIWALSCYFFSVRALHCRAFTWAFVQGMLLALKQASTWRLRTRRIDNEQDYDKVNDIFQVAMY